MKIAIFSVTPWRFLWQRPQHVAVGLAKAGFEVVYFEFSVPFAHWQLIEDYKEKDLFFIKKPMKNLQLVKQYYLYAGRTFKSVNRKLQQVFFESYVKLFQPDVAIIYSPKYHFLLGLLKSMGTKLVYDCVDEISGFSGLPTEVLKAEEALIEQSSTVIATSKSLCDKISKSNSKCFYIPNGVEFDHFNNATKTITLPPDIKDIAHPIIGFIGALWDWINVDLICSIAERHPEYSILLVGPVANGFGKLKQHQNITMVGTKNYSVLPQYMTCMDVCLIPFKINRLTLAANPIKMYEYLAAGKPVVSTALPEVCNNAAHVVKIAQDESDFIKKVEQTLSEAENDEERLRIRERISFAKNNSWQKRVEEIAALL